MSRPHKTRPVDDGLMPEITDHVIEEIARHVQTPDDLNQLSRQLLKLTVEKALSTELTDHLGYDSTLSTPSTGLKYCFFKHNQLFIKHLPHINPRSSTVISLQTSLLMSLKISPNISL